MSVLVNKDLCTGCNGLDEPLCVKYCPGDLMRIEKSGKAAIRNPEDCWDCMVCVKICPYHALETRLPYQLASYKANLKPEVYQKEITWELIDIDGKKDIFHIPTRQE